MLLSGTANDQLSEYDAVIDGLTLTSASGNTVTLLAQAGRPAEFIHVNGLGEPLLALPVVQDVYTSATLTVGGAQFTCAALNPAGGLVLSTYAGTTRDATVQLPAPITVSGESMTLNLQMLVSQSASYSSCATTGELLPYGITPTFALTTPTSSAAQQAIGRIEALDGQVAAVNASGGEFQVTLSSYDYISVAAPVVHVVTDGATVWQGVTGAAALTSGLFLTLDGQMRSDGSVQASRVALADPAAANVQRGPLLFVSDAVPELSLYLLLHQGPDPRPSFWEFDFSAASFSVSGFANLGSLPFTPSFTAADMVAGQNVYISSPRFVLQSPGVTSATTVTLMPQTINATIVGITSSAGFSVYSVVLADYDLFTTLAVQPGQTTRLTNPTQVQVYADSATLLLSASAPAVGDTLRFYGLVFNDDGTLRMDCARISDGVLSSSQIPGPNS